MAGAKVAMPDVAVAKVRRFCEAQNRHDLAEKLRNDFDVRGLSITIIECRPPWDGSPGEWTRTPIAQIRYDVETRSRSGERLPTDRRYLAAQPSARDVMEASLCHGTVACLVEQLAG